MSECVNLLDFTHRWLMANCDGEHANRFVDTFRNTQYDLCTQEGISAFNGLSYSEQVMYMVDYWSAQLGHLGVATSPESRNLTFQQALENFEGFLNVHKYHIEHYDLPKVFTQG